MVSKYPNAIDGYSDIRVVRDGIEEVLARDHNDNRSAIVAIEQSLGVNPQGTGGTVASRLYQGEVEFAQHAGGTGYRHTADQIDSASFATYGSKYSYQNGTVRTQLVQTGAFLAESATLLERVLDAFVVDGMSVTDPYGSGNTARVAAGHIASDGRLLYFGGGDLAVPPSGSSTTYYVYAVISNGSVSVGVNGDTLPSMDPMNPIVLLHRIVRAAGPWISSLDIRRYGMFVNDKNYFSVGQKPAGGEDGYGCDFTTLAGAIGYIEALAGGGRIIAPRKIVVVGDMTLTEALPIQVPSNFEIDGGGQVLTWYTDTEVFDLTGSSNVTLRNIHTSYGSLVTALNAATVRLDLAVNGGHRIIGCVQDDPNSTVAFFLSFVDNAAGDANILVSGCKAAAQASIIWSSYPGNGPNAARFEGNYFYQQTLGATGGPGILGGDRSVVDGNIVKGAFAGAIRIRESQSAVVSNNYIDAYASGIDLEHSYGAAVSGNVVLLRPGSGAGVTGIGSDSSVSGNVVVYGGPDADVVAFEVHSGAQEFGNPGIPGDPKVSIVGNRVLNCTKGVRVTQVPLFFGPHYWTSDELLVEGNAFAIVNPTLTPGAAIADFGNRSSVRGNTIVGYASNTDYAITSNGVFADGMVSGNLICNLYAGALGGINLSGGWRDFVATGNIVCGSPGTGIDVPFSSHGVISGNMLFGAAGSSNGIASVGEYSVVSNNSIVLYASDTAGYGIFLDGYQTVALGNTIRAGSSMLYGIKCQDGGVGTSFCVIAGNIVSCAAGSTGLLAGIMLGAQPSSSGAMVLNNHVGGEDGLPGVPNTGIDLASNSMVAVVGNSVRGLRSGLGGNGIDNVSDYSVVCSNLVLDPNEHGIRVNLAGNCAICSNSVIGHSSSGIEITSSNSMLVSGNLIKYFDSGFVAGIDAGCYNSVLSNNLIVEDLLLQNMQPIALNAFGNTVVGNVCVGGTQSIGAVAGSNNIVGNFLYLAALGIFVGGSDTNVVGNLIVGADPVSSPPPPLMLGGISISTSAFDVLTANNLVVNFGRLGGPGIDPSSCAEQVVVGNLVKNPVTGGVTGIKLDNADLLVAVANWAEGTDKGISHASVTRALITGNLSRLGSIPDATPGYWSVSSVIANNCFFA